MILVIDNYDSFTYNLVQYIGDIKKDIVTKRNDETTLKNVKEINPSHIVMHGKVSNVNHFGSKLFKGINDSFNATRYHSLIVDKASLPTCLEVIAENDNKTIMGLKHKTSNLYGVQFHPESIATKDGKVIIKNFLEI